MQCFFVAKKFEILKPFRYLQSVISEWGDKVKEFSCTDEFIAQSVDEFSDMMYRVAFNITKCRDDAFDVCQDVFVRLIKNRHKIKSREHLKAWLLRATVNRSKSVVTVADKRYCVSDDVLSEYSVASTVESFELFDAVMRLPEKYSTVIHLFYYEDLAVEQIAKTLEITKSAVKSRLHRGREQLKQILEKEN